MNEEKAENIMERDNEAPPILMVEVGSLLNYLLHERESSGFVSRVGNLRTALEKEWGFEPPPFLVKENPLIDERSYRFLFREKELARGKVHPRKTLVISSPGRLSRIPGKVESDPIYNQPCIWIEPAESISLQTTEPYTASIDRVIMEHLELVLRSHSQRFVTLDLIKDQVSDYNLQEPEVVHGVLSRMNLKTLTHIMKNLISEGIPLTFLDRIMKTLAFMDLPDGQNPDITTEILRKIFRDKIHSSIFGDRLLLFTLPDSKLQLWLFTHASKGRLDEKDPVIRKMLAELTNLYISFQGKGFRLGVICSEPVRLILRRILEKSLPDIVVLKPDEIDPDRDIMIIRKIRANGMRVWLNWQWFWLWARRSRKTYFRESLQRLNHFLSRRKKRQEETVLEDGLSISPPIPPAPEITDERGRNLPAPVHFTPGQKAGIFLLGCSDEFIEQVLSLLTNREIAILGMELSMLPPGLSIIRKEILRDNREMVDQWRNPGGMVDFIKREIIDFRESSELTALQKLAVLISVLSTRTAALIYRKILKNIPKKDLEEMVKENSSRKIKALPQLRASVVEDFLRYYKGSYFPNVLYSPKEWQGELQRACLRSPQKLAVAVRDLWLESPNLLENFDRFVYSMPEYASFWVRKFITECKKDENTMSRAEKAVVLFQQIPGELSDPVIQRMEKPWRKILANLPRDRDPGRETAGMVLIQFLSNYYTRYDTNHTAGTRLN